MMSMPARRTFSLNHCLPCAPHRRADTGAQASDAKRGVESAEALSAAGSDAPGLNAEQGNEELRREVDEPVQRYQEEARLAPEDDDDPDPAEEPEAETYTQMGRPTRRIMAGLYVGVPRPFVTPQGL